MHTQSFGELQHDHTFGQDVARAGELETRLVIILTGAMMVIEILGGVAFGSMALLADGLHMGSHTVALGLSAFAYLYARRHASDAEFTFGTGKVHSLAGFTGALLLAVFALTIAWESVSRLAHPVPIVFDQAIAVAVLGLLVNGLSVRILEAGHAHHDDHNVRSAYLHVLADALTSLLAIVALVAGKLVGWVWMDAVMGLVGAGLIGRWSWQLLQPTSAVLLDHQAPAFVCGAIREAIEAERDHRITDLHVWTIGPGLYAAIIGVATHEPRPMAYYKSLIPPHLGVAHATVEIHPCG